MTCLSFFFTSLINMESIEAVCLRLLEVGWDNLWTLLYDLLKNFFGSKMSFIFVNFVFQDRLKDFCGVEVSQILAPVISWPPFNLYNIIQFMVQVLILNLGLNPVKKMRDFYFAGFVDQTSARGRN